MGRFDGIEPSAPSVKTEIPGPMAKEQTADLDKVFDTRSLNMLTDYKASVGNYIADPDGNKLLDVYVLAPACRPDDDTPPLPPLPQNFTRQDTYAHISLTPLLRVYVAMPRSPPFRWGTTTPT